MRVRKNQLVASPSGTAEAFWLQESCGLEKQLQSKFPGLEGSCLFLVGGDFYAVAASACFGGCRKVAKGRSSRFFSGEDPTGNTAYRFAATPHSKSTMVKHSRGFFGEPSACRERNPFGSREEVASS